ncbi:MAG TPA: hypothetical protein VFJ47_08060 [Terriglobales bacterium]|nr:hypothetical protein [Terriglobales bacterium]
MLKASVSLLIALLVYSFACTAETAPSAGQQTAQAFVRQVLDNELNAENNDHSHWMLRLDEEKPGNQQVYEVVETKAGDLKRLLSVNGRPLSPEQERQQSQRIQELVNHPEELKNSHRQKSQDMDRSQRMLKTIPDAFLFEYGERQGDLVQVKFKPNPQFRPPSHEAAVFHAMEGTMWLDAKQKRLAEISGQLMHPVKFAGGLLGHLDAGGRFHVKQEEVEPGYWEMTQLNVAMRGKALFFKTIAVQEKTSRTMMRKVPDNLTLAQAANLLNQEVRAANASKNSPAHQ